MSNVARIKPGPKTVLTEELFGKIKKSILEGNDLRATAKICGILENTFYTWHSDNYLSLADKISNWKKDYKLSLANANIVEFLKMDDKNVRQVGKELIEFKDPALTRIKADMSKFVAETLGKDDYSKRSELTGKDGSNLIPESTKESEDLANKLNELEKDEIHKRTSRPSKGTETDIVVE